MSTCFAFPCHLRVAFDDRFLHPPDRPGHGPRKSAGHRVPRRCAASSTHRGPRVTPQRLTNVLYRIAAVDHRGRATDRHVTAALDWNAGTRLSIHEHNGLLVVNADPHGLFTPTKQSYLRLPADARRVAGVSVGDRVLLTAHVDRQTVTV
ncbi:hypothetical protein [Lentzea sp. CA-135723]|uniref:hypothetical protein n=1 Tax=Lentzea sp. CA-135723 TaxID=3239950 RepID=UPI003D929AD5